MIFPQKAQQTDNSPDSPTDDIGPYVAPKRDIDPEDAGSYHRMDVPGLEEKKWLWDLRGQEGSYLGNYDFNGKRVLEFGAANGALTFWMEQQGAEVVAVDLSPDIARTSWDILAGPEDDVAEIRRVMSGMIQRLNNAFWYAHGKLGSKVKLVHGTAYRVPTEIGRFDVVTLCAILLHLRDPLGALENALSFTDRSIIITEIVPRFGSEKLQHLPLAYFTPDKSRRTRHGGWTWWRITSEVYVRFLELKGFRIISNTSAFYKHKSEPRELYTLVAERV
jgi:SAM-dependent methyltransferase